MTTEDKHHEKFSESAHLYAENVNIVHAMARRFADDLDDFADEVRDGIKELLDKETLNESATRGKDQAYRTWWLDDSPDTRVPTKADTGVPYLWTSCRDPQTVLDSTLIICAYIRAAEPDLKGKILEDARSIDLPSGCDLEEGKTSTHIFNLKISFASSDDPTSLCAAIAAQVIQRITGSWRNWSGDGSNT